MVFSKEDTIDIETMKLKNKLEFEQCRHKNKIEELTMQLKIANAGGAKGTEDE